MKHSTLVKLAREGYVAKTASSILLGLRVNTHELAGGRIERMLRDTTIANMSIIKKIG